MTTKYRHPVHAKFDAEEEATGYRWTMLNEGRRGIDGEFCENLELVVETLDSLQEAFDGAENLEPAKLEIAATLTAIKNTPGHHCMIHG